MQETIIEIKGAHVVIEVEREDGHNIVRARLGDQIIDQRKQDATIIQGVDPHSCQIWRLYEQARRGNLVIRSGLGLCGCYNSYSPNAELNPRHPESVTEHASGCITIAHGVVNSYPHLLSPEYLHRLTFLLRYHDIGENSYQDRPDDGSQNALEKEAVELVEFTSMMLNLPGEFSQVAIKDFVQFQNARTAYDDDPVCFQIGQLARLIDKFEAVLSGVFYETQGVRGDLLYKSNHYCPLTEQDKYYMSKSSSTLVDSWAAHLVHRYYTFVGFPYLLDVLRAAVIDARGEWFPWFDKFCVEHNIPRAAIEYPGRQP